MRVAEQKVWSHHEGAASISNNSNPNPNPNNPNNPTTTTRCERKGPLAGAKPQDLCLPACAYDLRLSVQREIPCRDPALFPPDHRGRADLIRLKTRQSFRVPSSGLFSSSSPLNTSRKVLAGRGPGCGMYNT